MMTATWLAFLLVAFVLSGVSVPLLIDLVSINGGCEKTTFLVTLPGALGMVFCIFANWRSRNSGTVPWFGITGIALLEFFSQILNLTGLIYAGSAVFTVVYASVTMYTALFSYLLLHRHISKLQWAGVLTVMLGLALASIGAETDGPAVTMGVIMILMGSMSHSLTYIISEYLLLDLPDPISPELLSTLIGVIATLLNLTWQVCYTVPRFQAKVVDQIAAHHGSASAVVWGYVLIVAASTVHALCFFRLLGSVGSTSTGVCKGVQSVIVFVCSHFAYCSYQRSQCFTVFKGVSLVTVVAGVVLYSTNAPQHVKDADATAAASAAGSAAGEEQLEGEIEVELGGGVLHSGKRYDPLTVALTAGAEQEAADASSTSCVVAVPPGEAQMMERTLLLSHTTTTTSSNIKDSKSTN